jgi:hypothetical protein
MLGVGDGVHDVFVGLATAPAGASVALCVTVALKPSLWVVGTGATAKGVDSALALVVLLFVVLLADPSSATVNSSRLSL